MVRVRVSVRIRIRARFTRPILHSLAPPRGLMHPIPSPEGLYGRVRSKPLSAPPNRIRVRVRAGQLELC